MRKYLLCLILAGSVCYAQESGKISGTVKDRSTNTPLPGVNILIKETKLGASTTIDGTYFILNVPAGVYEVSASMIGYQGVTQQKVIVNINRTTTLDFILQETTVQGQEVIVTAERPDVVRERTSSAEIFRSEDVIISPGVQDITGLLTLTPDVSDGHFRGGREGEELYNLSGMGIVNPISSSRAFAPIMSAVEEVEVITSGFGAQYGNAQSGVVNVSMKEGNPTKWTSRVEMRTRIPGYKHWGGNVWSAFDQPYLAMMDSWEKMLQVDPLNSTATTTKLYFETFISRSDYSYQDSEGNTLYYLSDTQLAKLAYSLWSQARRDLNKNYNNLWDGSLDANAGGPITENIRMFLAVKSELEWNPIPAPEPDLKKQVMGNVVFDLGSGMTLRTSGAISTVDAHEYSSSYTDWLWDRVMGVGKSKDNNYQYGFRFAHAVTQRTFYEVKINRLETQSAMGIPVLAPDRYRTDDALSLAMWHYLSTPDGIRVGYMPATTTDERSTTTTIDASVTSQVSRSHMLNAGVQLNVYSVDVHNRTGLSSPGQAVDRFYGGKPREIGIFVQDKMEFEGMIANVGLRFDSYDQNMDSYVNVFNPLPGAPQEKTPIVTRVQPRIGISFPVSLETVFHLNYGSFLQRPAYQYTIYSSRWHTNGIPVLIGNPRLKPQDTKSYDVGVTQGLGEGFTFDASGYYKDVSNLIERAYFYPAQGSLEFYESYVNRDYADIRGFRLSLTKRRGIVSGSVKYNYGVATGKSSTPFNASPVIRENQSSARTTDNPNPKDVLLDFDRTHNLVLQLGIMTPEEFGFIVFDMFPFEKVSIAVNSFIRSGRPYTSPFEVTGLRYNSRTPFEYNTNLKISKALPKMFGLNTTFYVEVFNLLNDKIYNYNTVFQNVEFAKMFETDRDAMVLYTDPQDPGYVRDVSFNLFGNSPRSIYCALVFTF